jgi:nucleolar protein 56
MPRFEEATAKRGELLNRIALSDEAVLRSFAGVLARLQKYRDELESSIGKQMAEMAPNLTALAGPILGAKLIALAKGLSNLARMPGSRIQILGAGRAFFKGKKKKRPPKHGIIFQHPMVKGSPWWQRGKVARSLANKIAIAARVDAYSGGYVGEQLREELEERVERIRKQYQREPKRMRIIRGGLK